MKARNETASAVHAVTGGRLSWALVLCASLALVGVSSAQNDVNLPTLPGGPAAAAEQATPATTTPAEVMANDVYIRSGPGTNFYQCGRLYKGDRVQVAKTLQGWSAIVPPPGSYSWIAVQYVSVSIQNPTEGIVTGNSVPVYAGSDDLEPLVSTSKQDVTMVRGEKVRLLNEERDEYYKIVPPAGAYLWVSSQYLQAAQGPGVSLPNTTTAGGTQPQTGEAPGTAAPTPTEAGLLTEYYALSKQITEEQKKPLDQQDFTALKTKLKVLADNKEGGKASRYAEYTLKQIDRIELARSAAKELDQQKKDLQDSSTKIDEALKKRLEGIEDSGKYAVTGKLQPSALYSTTVAGQAKRYQLLDDNGNIKCYVAPAGAAATKDLAPFIGHKVGLVGQIQAQAATARPFVEFSDIVRLD
jgi:uncharacterized protein YgiM (DUF1202 family)